MRPLSFYRERIQRALGAKHQLSQQLEELKGTLKSLTQEEEDAAKARAIIQEVAQETQQHLEFQISSLVTHALQSVFDDTYSFVVKFVQKNNRTQCELLFEKDGEQFEPMESAGGGVLDVASFALRVAFWAMRRTAPVFILDEPFKFVSHDKQERVGLLLKSLSEKLGVQIIMISHLQNLINSADNVVVLDSVKNKRPKKALPLKKKLPRRTQA